MVIVRISGGLGNQMFQYAFYMYLKKKRLDVAIDINDYEAYNYHHGFELKKIFGIEPVYAEISDVKRIAFFKQGILCKIYRKLFKRELRKKTEMVSYDPQIDYSDHEVYFDGIWQNPSFLSHISQELQDEFKFKVDNISNDCLDMVKKIMGCNSISVHVRRGDYLNNSKFEGICDENYYINSIKYMRSNCENAVFFVISDDIPWCQEKLRDLSESIVYVNVNRGENSYLDMYLMTLCQHNIIANSTFSWWGAWLNSNPEKIVVCPSTWDISGRDLSLDTWIKM